MDVNGNERLRFGDYELDHKSGTLLREGWPVKIQPQPLRVLCILIETPGELVSRDQLRSRIWGDATFVEFDEGLNYCIRQIRLALRDKASDPAYIQTLPKQGYRFIAPLELPPNHSGPVEHSNLADQPSLANPTGRETASSPPGRSHLWVYAFGCSAVVLMAALATYHFLSLDRKELKYTQLTDLTDSAVVPALSPDGHTLAFIRGSNPFLTADPIYAKLLPNGETRLLTDDPRSKYHLAFSPDGSQVTYTVLNPPGFDTYSVPVLGGKPSLLLKNAAGLNWLDPRQLLFSQTRTGIHMGVVTGTLSHEGFRDIYFPAHQRGMAHYSYASPDRKFALVIEMQPDGYFGPCQLISLDSSAPPKPAGPVGNCGSAAWSPDGSWIYFSAVIDEKSHLWRQRFPDGSPEQLTFGPTEESGVVVEPGGRSLLTSIGLRDSSIWIHDEHGDRSLLSEGDVSYGINDEPAFTSDGNVLYYALRHADGGLHPELRRLVVQTGESESVLPGIPIYAYDVSPDGKWVVFSKTPPSPQSQIWLAPTDRSSPPKVVSQSGKTSPRFGPAGQILFLFSVGHFNYLGQMKRDGSAVSKVVPYPISDILTVSPGRHWTVAIAPFKGTRGASIIAIPTAGGSPRVIMQKAYCVPQWSSNGKFLFVPVMPATSTNPGRSLAIPLGPEEALPSLPPAGLAPDAQASAITGSQSVNRADLIPGPDPNHFAYLNRATHSNIYRVTLP